MKKRNRFGGGKQEQLEADVNAARVKELMTPYVKQQPAVVGNVGTVPAFSTDYVAFEETTVVSNTNGEVVDDQVCCIAAQSTSKGNGECLVSTGAQKGNRYRDVTNQRDRFEDQVSGLTNVVIYGNNTPGAPGDGGMDMTINVTNGVETCAHFCPLLPGEGLDVLALDPNATDVGAVTFQGLLAAQYE